MHILPTNGMLNCMHFTASSNLSAPHINVTCLVRMNVNASSSGS